MLKMKHSKMFRRLEKTSIGPKIDEQNSKWLKRQLENHWAATPDSVVDNRYRPKVSGLPLLFAASVPW